MRSLTLAVVSGALALAACSKADRQADALDNAADQADPAAAAVMRNAADDIRANGTDAAISAPGSPVQDAMSNAGAAAATSDAPPGATTVAEPKSPAAPNTQAKPHEAGETMPPKQH